MQVITVRGAGDDGRVALYERDPAHPRGQALVAHGGKAVQVALTPAVKRLLAAGSLVQVQVTPVQTAPTRVEVRDGLGGLGLTPEQAQTLIDAGYGDRVALAYASDAALMALPGIGRATVAKLRAAVEA